MSDPISIVDIIKPKRAYKPRMSAVVSKAVLYKQLSEADLTKPLPPPKIEVPTTNVLTPALPTGLAVVEHVEEAVIPKTKPVSGKVVIGRCIDCFIDFTSELLFKRHLGTIKHKLTLHKLALHTTVSPPALPTGLAVGGKK